MSRIVALLAIACLAAGGATQGPGGRFAFPRALARAADGDGNGAVSAQERRDLLAAVAGGAGGAVDKDLLRARLLVGNLDQDGDGDLDRADLEAAFSTVDADGDGALSAAELDGGGGGGGRRRGMGVLSRAVLMLAADREGDGAVTAAEWQAFLAGTPAGTVVPLAELGAWLKKVLRDAPPDRTAFTPGVYLLTLDAGMDVDRNGTVTRADLDAAFRDLDRDGNGEISATELNRPRGNRGPLGGRRITEEDKRKPCLMPWQRNLEDALALVESTGKPLLICVNMDGEPASESLAWQRYRDPEFARLADGFICLIVSVDRRQALDYDDRGHRLPDPRFGRVINQETIAIEPVLFVRYFGGQRVAPRHMGIAQDGSKLFDIYLSNDLGEIDRALEKHGKRTDGAPEPGSRSLEQLLASPEAGHRDELEQRFAAGTAAVRARIAAAALDPERSVRHSEILRMALRDEGMAVRQAAVGAMVAHPEKMPMEHVLAALRAASVGSRGIEQVVSALAERTAVGGAEGERAARLAHRFAALHRVSTAVDRAAWTKALAQAPGVSLPALDPTLVPVLDQRLSSLEKALAERPGDAELRVQFAGATLHYARIRQSSGKDPSFLLQDARRAVAGIDAESLLGGRARGYRAWAAWLLGDGQAAAGDAARALPMLLEDAGSPLAGAVLHVLALSRSQEVYGAMGQDREADSETIADARAAWFALLEHPVCTEDMAVAAIEFCVAMEAWSLQDRAVHRAIRRLPLSGRLHGYLRAQVLADQGARALERRYQQWTDLPAGARPTVEWYGGLASLQAAERQVQCLRPRQAVAAYDRAVVLFEKAWAAQPAFEDSSRHYVAMAHAGAARVLLATDPVAASGRIREGLELRPASALTEDGLGNSPLGTGRLVIDALEQAGHATEAKLLGEVLKKSAG